MRSLGSTNDSKDMRYTNNLLITVVLSVLTLSTTTLAGTTIGHDEFIENRESLFGNWSIKQATGKNYIVHADDFRDRRGPYLKIFLSPQSIDSFNGKTAVIGSVIITNLKEIKGGQLYQIPSELDISQYNRLLIHCEKYPVLRGGGVL